MNELRQLLEARTSLCEQADIRFDASAHSLEGAIDALAERAR